MEILAFSWVLIPITAILVGGFTEWLKFRAKQQQLGFSTKELQETVASLRSSLAASEERQKALTGRIQNLEAIVTSQVWDAVHDPVLPVAEKERRLAEANARLSLPEEEPPAARAERIARRLQI
jgi:hypothetical protein